MSLVQLTIKGISYSHTQNGAYALILNEVNGARKLPIVIGAFEAQAIAIAIEEDLKPPRPLTHDLFKTFCDRFDIVVKQVIIHKLVDGVFFSSIICERDGIEEIIDARTSDAISLALRFDAPIFTYQNILDKAGIYLREQEEADHNEEEDFDDEDDDFDNDDSNDESLNDAIDEFLNLVPNEKASEFASLSVQELNDLLEMAVLNEDYEKAARLRDELSKRNL
ncbi:bifunctional nuclease family protein [Flavobacterium sp. CBA20B-1]|uniref:Bifunctional nuclease family protein n=1 Tax=Paenimyroides aestuarii TaxID=2968490 RepID=A0ABY5NRU4_9FLAO|nr:MULTISPECIES: bifunctional nuclease family protein [Flavobacteriaceae]UUV21305.1 bifunctional nuclease family protein [Paenimyroides aestuarii]WCM42216.1 bifunctional nuclease family protein [Flavobacterium sp. CBA20B-1]